MLLKFANFKANLFNFVFSTNKSQSRQLLAGKHLKRFRLVNEFLKIIWNIQENSVFSTFSLCIEQRNAPTLFFLVPIIAWSSNKVLKTEPFRYKEKVQRYKMKCKVFCKKMLPQENRCLDVGGKKDFCSPLYIWHLQMTLSSMSILESTYWSWTLQKK